MSRSYKKNPVISTNRSNVKRAANKKVRKSKYISSGKNYIKTYCSWNIRDYTKSWWKDFKNESKNTEEAYKQLNKMRRK